MSQTDVLFIEVPVNNKIKFVCEIVEKLYNQGKSVLVYTGNQSSALRIHQQLWIFKPDSFIPHALAGDSSAANDEPVIISNGTLAPLTANVLILYDPVNSTDFDLFEQVIDFAELYDPVKLQASRERYKMIRDQQAGYNLKFMKLGEFLGK